MKLFCLVAPCKAQKLAIYEDILYNGSIQIIQKLSTFEVIKKCQIKKCCKLMLFHEKPLLGQVVPRKA